jgi:hypothetical protein
MKENEVPQDDANLFEGKTRDVQYAVNKDGKYIAVKSIGWDPKNTMLQQAWEVENKKITDAKNLVEAGIKSPVYFHMIRCLMDVKLLASYVKLPRYKVKRHFNPKVFSKLPAQILDRYVYAFGLKQKEELTKFGYNED